MRLDHLLSKEHTPSDGCRSGGLEWVFTSGTVDERPIRLGWSLVSTTEIRISLLVCEEWNTVVGAGRGLVLTHCWGSEKSHGTHTE